jgi:hypothetical protein
MQAINTMYYKVFAQKQHNAFTLCITFNAHVAFTQRSAACYVTLCNITQSMLQAAVARMQQQHNAVSVQDCTNASTYKVLQKLFAAQAAQ